jgi:large subunit ribosomal protein L14
MILVLTKLDVSDNSGIKSVKCFKVYKSLFATVGSLVYVSVKEIKTNTICKYKKGTILKGIIVRTKNNLNRNNGNFVSFESNSVVLIDTKHDLIATRIFGPLPIELRRKGLLKLLSLGSVII